MSTTTKKTAKPETVTEEQPPDIGRRIEPKGLIGKVGNLTRDPELGFGTENGTRYCRFGLAVQVPKEPGNWSGERGTTFYEAIAFGSLAEHVAELTKGTRVVVAGKGELEHWTDAEGTERTTKRIVVDGCGPDLRWATATVQRDSRSKPRSEPAPAADDHSEADF